MSIKYNYTKTGDRLEKPTTMHVYNKDSLSEILKVYQNANTINGCIDVILHCAYI